MNTKNNRRRRESVEKIEQTFLELLQTTELNEISVSDICKRCDLNRSTFYANFMDIYDLAGRVRLRLEEEVSALYRPDRERGHNSNDYLRLLRHIRDNQLLYRTYFKLGYDNQFRLGGTGSLAHRESSGLVPGGSGVLTPNGYLNARDSSLTLKYDNRLAEQYFGNRHIEYHIEFFRSGFNAIVKMWLERGCKESPEEIEDIIRSEYQGRSR